MSKRILRIHDVTERTGLGRSTIYRRIADQTFPPPIPLGERAVGWLESEVEGWMEDRTQERNSAKENAK